MGTGADRGDGARRRRGGAALDRRRGSRRAWRGGASCRTPRRGRRVRQRRPRSRGRRADGRGGVLDGEDVGLEAIPVDIADRPAWDRLVLDAVRAIPRGHTAGYGEVARRIGRPGAARAVGGAVGRNPVGLLVPCHRVIAGDGTLGGYGAAAWGGREAALDLKRELLALEGVEVVRGRVSAG